MTAPFAIETSSILPLSVNVASHLGITSMNWYNIKFEGRENGALGVTSFVIKTVEATDKEAAILRLYDSHEHIRVISIEDVADEPRCGRCES